MAFWLMKSEPTVYGIDHLERDGETLWDGVRNYQARNFLRSMALGDRAFFYHSNCNPPGIVGLMAVTEVGVMDPTQFDPQNPYFDPKATPEQPRWWTVRVRFETRFTQTLTLTQLKATFSPEELGVVKKGNRLSVLPVPPVIADQLLAMAQGKAPNHR